MAIKKIYLSAIMIAGLTQNAIAFAEIPNNITVSGVIEAEAGSSKDYAGNEESGYALATFELGIDAKINEIVDGHVLILHEDGGTEPWEVDEGTVTLHNLENQYYLSAGRMYVPFGNFSSNLVSDPLTLEIGETREAAVQIGFDFLGITGSAYSFNGDTIKTEDSVLGDDPANQNGFALGYAIEAGDFNLDIGAGYINNIADTDGISGNLATPQLVDYVPGSYGHLIIGYGPVTLTGEYVGAADKFDVTELAWLTEGAQPKASNTEIAVTFPVMNKEITIAAAQQQTIEAVALGLPEKRTLAAISIGLFDKTSLALESLQDEDYSLLEGGTGETAKVTTLQLAVEF